MTPMLMALGMGLQFSAAQVEYQPYHECVYDVLKTTILDSSEEFTENGPTVLEKTFYGPNYRITMSCYREADTKAIAIDNPDVTLQLVR